MLKLTPENRLHRFREDVARVQAGRPADFSIGQHVALLIQRVEALERIASGIEARSGETPVEAARSEGREPDPKGDAPTQSEAIQ